MLHEQHDGVVILVASLIADTAKGVKDRWRGGGAGGGVDGPVDGRNSSGGRSGRRGWVGVSGTEEIEGKGRRIGCGWVGGVRERGSRELG